MIALRISINGEILCTAGAEDLSVLTGIVGLGGPLGPKTTPQRPDESLAFRLHIGGLTSRESSDDVHLRWKPDLRLSLNDRVEIQIIETPTPDQPEEESPAGRPETRERERFLNAKETYLRLKSKFEPPSS